MENAYSVYIHTNKIDNKKYVGLTKRKPKERWREGTQYKNSTHFDCAIQKYGWENFEHEIYASGLTAEEASNLERELIAKLNTIDMRYGYNLDSGGFYSTHSESTKEKIRRAITGIKRSPETKEKIRKAATGNKNCLGRKQTEESKQKNREAHYNKTHTLSDETKKRIMLSQKTRKEVICIELDRIFPSVGEAARFFHGSQSTLSQTLSGRNKTAFGYHWKFKNDNDKKSNDYPVRE